MISRAGCCLIVTSLLVLVAAPAGAAGAAGGHSKCSVGRSRVIAAGRMAVVFETFPTASRLAGVWGCVRGHARFRLGSPESCGKEGCGGISHVVLGGSTVAYWWQDSEGEGGLPGATREFVVVRDLRDDRLLRRVAASGVQSIVVRGDGAAAWIGIDAELSPGERLVTPPCEPLPGGGSVCPPAHFVPPYVYAYDVLSSDRTGLHRLAAGIDVDASSLILSGKAVHWTQGGRPSSAPLR